MTNDNRTLITHMRTDPNAHKHAAIGAICSAVGFTVYLVTGFNLAILFFLFPTIVGVGIEILQRIQGGKNTNLESILDILTTILWPVYYIQVLFK